LRGQGEEQDRVQERFHRRLSLKTSGVEESYHGVADKSVKTFRPADGGRLSSES
jgi:hypothetical protein